MEQDNDLFNVQVNEDGKRSIVKIYTLTKIFFWSGLLVQGLVLFNSIRSHLRLRSLSLAASNAFSWYINVLLFYSIVVSVLVLIQSYCFLMFSSKANQSILLNESSSFNESLNWMYRTLWLALVSLAVTGLFAIYTTLRHTG